jgi:hypothetical protein
MQGFAVHTGSFKSAWPEANKIGDESCDRVRLWTWEAPMSISRFLRSVAIEYEEIEPEDPYIQVRAKCKRLMQDIGRRHLLLVHCQRKIVGLQWRIEMNERRATALKNQVQAFHVSGGAERLQKSLEELQQVLTTVKLDSYVCQHKECRYQRHLEKLMQVKQRLSRLRERLSALAAL